MIFPHIELGLDGFGYYQLLKIVEQLDYRDHFNFNRPVDVQSLSSVPDIKKSILYRSAGNKNETVLIKVDGISAHAYINYRDNVVYVSIASPSPEDSRLLENWLKEKLPEAKADDGSIPVSFYAMGSNGHRVFSRSIDTPSWESIRDNYSAEIQTEMDRLVSIKSGDELFGRFILWRGSPGTGKTHLLRALGREWRKWCNLQYVTDPEAFFGTRPDYMMSVLLENNNRLYVDPDDYNYAESSSKWNLIVLEDSGELFTPDAKMNAGQGYSRFLNVVDGLIGQGLKVITLATANEELGKLSPAVQRNGRCASLIEFGPLGINQSYEWLKNHNYPDIDKIKINGPVMLSDLYGMLANEPIKSKVSSVTGFNSMATVTKNEPVYAR